MTKKKSKAVRPKRVFNDRLVDKLGKILRTRKTKHNRVIGWCTSSDGTIAFSYGVVGGGSKVFAGAFDAKFMEDLEGPFEFIHVYVDADMSKFIVKRCLSYLFDLRMRKIKQFSNVDDLLKFLDEYDKKIDKKISEYDDEDEES